MSDATNPLEIPAAQRALARFDPKPTLGARAVTLAVATSSKALMNVANRTTLVREDRLHEARQLGRGLLTFSNHVSLFDDPWVTACLSGPHWESLRWIAADALNFFGSPRLAPFFNAGKCVPIVRGAGLEQPGMAFLADRLQRGDWVHVFPEGTRTRRGDASLHLPFKGGLAWLVQQSQPMVLPFVHEGMERVLPVGARLPRFGQRVVVAFGEATDTAAELAGQTMEQVTSWAERQLQGLQAELRGAVVAS